MVFKKYLISSLSLIAVICSELPPIIDLSDAWSSNPQSRLECSIKVDAALREYGVFVAVGHFIGPQQYDSALAAARNLFGLSMNDKRSVSMDAVGGIGRGYLPFGRESGVSSYFEPKEGYSYGYNFIDQHSEHPLQRVNIWPTDLKHADSIHMEDIYRAAVGLAKIITGAISTIQNGNCMNSTSFDPNQPISNDVCSPGYVDSIDSAVDYERAIEGGDTISLMRLFHYFSPSSLDVPRDKQLIGSSPHTDWVSGCSIGLSFLWHVFSDEM